MATLDGYICDVLGQVLDARRKIESLPGKAGDLDILKKETLRARGLLLALDSRLGSSDLHSDALRRLLRLVRGYLLDYDFQREFETLALLYSEDPGRIRNMRYKILESFDHGRFSEQMREILSEL